jgi:hypothetical protein
MENKAPKQTDDEIAMDYCSSLRGTRYWTLQQRDSFFAGMKAARDQCAAIIERKDRENSALRQKLETQRADNDRLRARIELLDKAGIELVDKLGWGKLTTDSVLVENIPVPLSFLLSPSDVAKVDHVKLLQNIMDNRGPPKDQNAPYNAKPGQTVCRHGDPWPLMCILCQEQEGR